MPIKRLDGRMLDSSGKLVINECFATSITGTNSTFTNITGTNSTFNSSTFNSSTFANITGTNINGTNITGDNSIFTNSTFTNSTFTNITGTNSFLTNVNGTNSTFVNITGTNSTFNNSIFTNITGTNCLLTNITGTNFYSTNEYITNTYSVTSLNVNGDINTTGAMYGGVGITIIDGTTYTIPLSDNGGIVASTNNTTGLTASVVGTGYPKGFQVAFMQLSGSDTTGRIVVTGDGIPINQANGYYKTTKQYSSATLIYFGPPAGWVLFGDVSY